MKYAGESSHNSSTVRNILIHTETGIDNRYPMDLSLRKHAYSNILKILPPKNENFQTKIPIFFIRKIMYTPVNPCFTI